MYILSKVIYFLINPITWISILLILALANKKHRLKLLRMGVFTFLFFSFTPIFQVFAYLWEVPLTPIEKIEAPYDFGIVLGGFSTGSVRPFDRLHFTSASTRLTTAVELYQKGKVKKLLITGGSFKLPEGQVAEAKRVEVFLKNLGIPEKDIVIEDQSLNTRENATLTKAIIDQQFPKSSCLLITSAWHMRRSEGCFKKAGLAITPFSTDPFAAQLERSWYYYLFPNASSLRAWQFLTKEWFGYVMYKVAGYI